MKILLFKYKGPIQSFIKWQTRSKYSHAAIEFNGEVFESVLKKGVHSSPIIHFDPKSYDVFTLKTELTEEEEKIVYDFCHSQVGKKYDYWSVFRFLTRTQETRKSFGRWFCSELVFAAVGKVVKLLDRIDPCNVSPEGINISPLLRKI